MKKSDNNEKKVFFFASFGNLFELPAGGGQTSARRMMKTLKEIGLNVYPTNRHRPRQTKVILRKIEIYFWAFLDPILFGCSLLHRDRKNAIVLFIGYSGAMLLMETAIGIVSKALGYKVVFYLKGGGTKQLYDKGNSFYRATFRNTLKLYNEVFVEGEENAELIRNISKTKVFYMPNFTEDGFAPDELPAKPKDVINIIYFGRISRDKNIIFAIDVYDEICKEYNNVFFNLVGNSEDDYGKIVRERISNSKNSNSIKRVGKISHDELKLILKEHHIFLFPSKEPREGHSNSLNEAMAWGVVPVVSYNNFLPSIVGDNTLVANGDSVRDYFDIIKNLIENPKIMEKKSTQVYMRVKKNFTQSKVEKRLLREIEDIFKS